MDIEPETAAPLESLTRKGEVIPPGRGESYWAVGDLVTFKIGPEHSAGALAVAETLVLPGGGPPPHVHTREDEIFYILDGQLQLMLEDRVFTGGAGDAFFLPRGKVHTFHNASNRPTRMIVMATPCGFECFMREFAIPRSQSPQPPTPKPEDMARLTAAAARFGLQLRPDHKPANAPAAPKRDWEVAPVMGMRIELKHNTADTNRQLSLCTIHTPVGLGAPVHAHRDMDELFYVEQGTFEFPIDGRPQIATAGTTVFVPRGVMHGFKNIGHGEGRLMDIHLPSGFEDFFRECGKLTGEPTEAQVKDLFNRHGMDMPAK